MSDLVGNLKIVGFLMHRLTLLRKYAHTIYRDSFTCKNKKNHWKSFDIFMPPTLKKLRGHIGLGLSVQ